MDNPSPNDRPSTPTDQPTRPRNAEPVRRRPRSTRRGTVRRRLPMTPDSVSEKPLYDTSTLKY